MKSKKLILIPGAMLCLGALFACGKSKPNFFEGLTNGFESTEFEKYLKLPTGLSTIDKGYGEYIRDQALFNSFETMKSTKTEYLSSGTSPFFLSMPIYNPGQRVYEIISGRAIAIGQMGQFDSFDMRTPFSDNAQQIKAESVTEYYGSTNTNPVIRHYDKSYRATYDAHSSSVIYTSPTNNEYLCWADKKGEKEEGDLPYYVYRLTKGSKNFKFMSADKMANDGADDVIFKTKENGSNNLSELKKGIELMAQAEFNEDFRKCMNAMPECATIDSLQRSDFGYAQYALASEVSSADSAIYLTDGKNNAYVYYTYVSNQGLVPTSEGSLMSMGANAADPQSDGSVPAYETTTILAKMTYLNNKWVCSDMTTGFKVYLTADENQNVYSQPKCFCSEYYRISASYDKLGEFGKIEDAELYNAPNFTVGLNFYNMSEDERPDPDDPEQVKIPNSFTPKKYEDTYLVNFNPLTDSNIFTNGGIYDHTYSARKAGQEIPDDEYMFYGSVNFAPQWFVCEDENGKHPYDSSNYCFTVSINNAEGEPIDVLIPDSSTFAGSASQYLEIVDDSDPNKPDGAIKVNDSRTFDFIIQGKPTDGGFEVTKFVIANYN